MALQGIIQRQLVQVVLTLQVDQLFGTRIMQANPDKVAGFSRPVLAFIQADVGDFLAFAVDGGGNDAAHNLVLSLADGISAQLTGLPGLS